ncbi:aspartate/glutamate racemase family protein [Nocardiopsis sediminis]|uniref:Aspartate/glutamate racemase family protein n=1 Tax=Nocardiopsis sediminis TaxID=1778267 RepID=A0ABV8FMX1_9ACTN
MRILVVNPNRIAACTRLIRDTAQAAAAPGTEITAVHPDDGPVELSGDREVLLSAMGVLAQVDRHAERADAVIMAGFGEPGREAVRASTRAPVFDITECAPAVALTLGRDYAVVTSTPAAVPVVEDRLRALGLGARCTGTHATGLGVPDMVAHPAAALETVIATAASAEGEVVVLGCGGMAGMAAEVARATGRPVVEGVAAAVTLAQATAAVVPVR